MSVDAVLAGAARWHVEQGDCLPWLATLPDRCVAHVITDPPYSEHVHTKSRAGSRPNQGASMILPILRIGSHALPLPSYAHPGDAGLDLAARLDIAHGIALWGSTWTARDVGTSAPRLTLAPRTRALVPCGFAFAIPDGYEGQVRPRSSCFKRGLHVATGTIDAGYRGEVLVGVWNLSGDEVDINHGDRIAQLVIAPVTRCEVCEVDELDATARGAGGFGSTGR